MYDLLADRVSRWLAGLGRTGYFVGSVGRGLTDVGSWGGLAVQQMRRIGVASVPIALFIAAFTGIVLALQASYTFTGAVIGKYARMTTAPNSLIERAYDRTAPVTIPREASGSVTCRNE